MSSIVYDCISEETLRHKIESGMQSDPNFNIDQFANELLKLFGWETTALRQQLTEECYRVYFSIRGKRIKLR